MTDMQTSLPLLIVQPSILNPIINFSTHLWPVKWNALGYTFGLRIPFHLQCRCNTCTNTINNDMIHFISSRDHIGSSIWLHLLFTVAFVHRHQVFLKLHRHAVHRSKASNLPFTLATGPSSQVLSWSSPPYHMTQCHVSCALSSFIITCVSFATSPSHFHLHGICCSYTCTCGLSPVYLT